MKYYVELTYPKASRLPVYGLTLEAESKSIAINEVIEPKYRCKICNTALVVRSGKYGEFLACPKSTIESKHPTMKKPIDYDVGIKISVKAMRAIHAPYMVPDLATRIRREYEDFSAVMGLEPMYKTDEECHGAIIDHDVPFIF